MTRRLEFTKEDRKEIMSDLKRGVPATILARERGVHPATIRNVPYHELRHSDEDDE